MTIALGLVGVSGLVFGSVKLFKATKMPLENIRAAGGAGSVAAGTG